MLWLKRADHRNQTCTLAAYENRNMERLNLNLLFGFFWLFFCFLFEQMQSLAAAIQTCTTSHDCSTSNTSNQISWIMKLFSALAVESEIHWLQAQWTQCLTARPWLTIHPWLLVFHISCISILAFCSWICQFFAKILNRTFTSFLPTTKKISAVPRLAPGYRRFSLFDHCIPDKRADINIKSPLTTTFWES